MADETKATDAGQRYAQSLFELTIEGNQLTKVEADLKSLKAMYADSADLRRLVASPAFSSEDKAKGLAAIAKKAGFQPLTSKFIGLVASNGRAGDLMGAITAFAEMSAKHRGVVTAQLPPHTRGVLEGSVQGRSGITPFAWWSARFGLWPMVLLAVALTAVLALATRWRRAA